MNVDFMELEDISTLPSIEPTVVPQLQPTVVPQLQPTVVPQLQGDLDYGEVLSLIQEKTGTGIEQLSNVHKEIFACMGFLPPVQSINEQYFDVDEIVS